MIPVRWDTGRVMIPSTTPPRHGAKTPGSRAAKAAERRDAIVAAALAEFSEKGFAAARLDDVAKRAGVAKGTIYLHFADKRALFEGIVHLIIGPALAQLETGYRKDGESMRGYLERIMLPIALSLGTSPRRDVVRLLIAEGARFPEVAEIYYREVVERAMALVRELARSARETGEIGDDTLARFPQLLIAPALVGTVWSSLFERFQPLDIEALFRAQLDLLFGPPTRVSPA
jgi:AcrR family transcriptional regulator